MKNLRHFADLRFATKILLLTGLMGVIAIAITAYTLANMRFVNGQYRDLIAHEAQGALTIAEAARHLDGASRLAYTVLTEPDEVRMLALLGELQSIQAKYDRELRTLERVLPTKTVQVKAMAAGSERVFESAVRIITAASRWRGDQALQIIHTEFEPALRSLRASTDSLRDDSVLQFNSLSARLSDRTAQTIFVTALAIAGALALVIPLSLYIAITQMSRPIAQLTHAMLRMSERHYNDDIALSQRTDEVGQMANALRVFQRSMQREDRLAIEVAASAQARRLSEQLVDLTSAIPGAVFQMHVAADGTRRILFASERAAQLFFQPVSAFMQEEAPAGHEFQFADRPSIRRAHNAFVRSAQTLEPLQFDTETVINGESTWLRTLATARRSQDGGALFNGVWLNVTEQKVQAKALAKAKEVAETIAAEKAGFLATMSHEIRTPLNAVLGMTQLAIHHEPSPDQLQRLQKTMRAGRYLLNIVNDVLDLSKMEAGKMVMEAAVFSPREWLDELKDLLVTDVAAKGLSFQLVIAPDTPFLVCGDRHRMSQIVINYVSNAIKFTERGSITIDVNTVESDEHGALLRCNVHDTGIGVAEVDQAALFAAFAQADASITRRFGGTGLGLAISRQLAHLMGGEAGMNSTPGGGSNFWFTARVATASSAGDEEIWVKPVTSFVPLSNPGTPFRRGTRVLLVDDNELNRAVARGMLEIGGIAVDEACHGAQALAMLESADDNRYALVLMDMQMPVMDGLTATRVLRERTRFAHLPVVALTANASEEDIARTRAAGMNDHLAKPLLEESLWRCMHHWLEAFAEPRERPTSTVTTASASTDFDASVIQELRDVLGTARAQTLAATYLRDCESRFAKLSALAANEQNLQWELLVREAHDLSGTAGSFGLVRLGEMAHVIETLAMEHDKAGALRALKRLLKCGRADLAALERCVEAHRPAETATLRALT